MHTATCTNPNRAENGCVLRYVCALRIVQMIILIPFGDIQMAKDSEISINNAKAVNIPMPMYNKSAPNQNARTRSAVNQNEDDSEPAGKSLKKNSANFKRKTVHIQEKKYS